MPAAANILQLRQLLAEKFPGLRTHLEEPAGIRSWPSGIAHLDEPLRGGLPQGALTEMVSDPHAAGSATLLHALLSRAAAENQIIALVDGSDSLDVTRIDETTLPRLLWIRCHGAIESMKAADMVLRDGNLSLVLVDLKMVPEQQLRKIPPTTWYRFQRLIEQTATVCVISTPRPMISPAQARITLRSGLSLDALERDAVDLLGGLQLEVMDARHSTEAREALQNTA